jgi:sigma-B regulation protein RsbQ
MPDSTLVHIENIGHCPHLSAPQAIADAMKAFLR